VPALQCALPMCPTDREIHMQRRHLLKLLHLCAAATPWMAWANDEAPDALVKRVSTDVLNTFKADPSLANDMGRIMGIVDSKLMPHVNFNRMTASAVGRHWRQATPEQQAQLQEGFKALLVRTYSGALTEVKNLTVVFKPLRAQATDTEVVVRSEVRGRGEPIQLDYRLEKTPQGWKIYDLNVLGVWLVETYRGQFAQEITAKGIDGLITTLRNRSAGRPG